MFDNLICNLTHHWAVYKNKEIVGDVNQKVAVMPSPLNTKEEEDSGAEVQRHGSTISDSSSIVCIISDHKTADTARKLSRN